MSDNTARIVFEVAALAGAAWAYAVSPRPPFLRRLESVSLTPSSAQKDPAPLVPDTPACPPRACTTPVPAIRRRGVTTACPMR